MKNLLIVLFLYLIICFPVILRANSFSDNKPYNSGIHIIPRPLSVIQHNGFFRMNANTKLIALTPEAKKVASFFAAKIKTSTGYDLKNSTKISNKNVIQLIINDSITSDEGYRLEADTQQVSIQAKTAQGLFYGMQTFMQLLPAEIESSTLIRNVAWKLPAVTINDEPRFEYRGFMLDVCRHFIPVENIKKQLETLSIFKINTFHWHLTDDQGWRIEIKKYPNLTEIGSKRIDPDGHLYSGFYTQEQIKDVVAYAAERFITVIPEIEMPGHALGAIASYPTLSCFPRKFKVRNIMGIEQDVYCAGKEETFRFLEDVISEVALLFPGKYFHIGGDECPKDKWKICPLCQQRMKDKGLKDEHELQSYFVQRIEKILTAHGKKMIGWDEILEGGLAPSATVMSWRGEKGGIEAATMNHDVIMTPSTEGMYLDYYQGDPKIEPVAIGGYVTLEKTYSYDPMPEEIPVDKQKFVKGVQCNVWTEFMYNPDIVEYRMYPRILALAELAWTAKNQKNYSDFLRRLDNVQVRLDKHLINYYIPRPEQPNGSCNFIAFTDTVSLKFTTSRPVKLVYTLDGSVPDIHSMVYTKTLFFHHSSVLNIRSVLPSGKMCKNRKIEIEKQQLSSALPLIQPHKGLKLQYADGLFLKMDDLKNAKNWKDTIINKVNDITSLKKIVISADILPYAAIAEGYIFIPEDGVFFLSSDLEKVWIDGTICIDNTGEVKLYSRHDSSRALAKGYHRFKAAFLNHSLGGWPSDWNDGSVRLRKSTSDKFIPIAPDQFFY